MFAAGGTIVNAAPEAGAVYVQNGNGAYLQKIDNAWYLFDAEDQRVAGLQYISINPDQIIDETERGGLNSGFYMFASDGRMVQSSVLYYFSTEQTVAGVTFKGYHITDADGRFSETEYGLKYFATVPYKTGVKKLNDYYYQGAYGRLTTGAKTLHYLNTITVNGKKFSAGYYYFSANGRLYQTTGLKYVARMAVGTTTFSKGYYYFATNGRLNTTNGLRYLKKTTVGTLTFKTGYYYFTTNGRLVITTGARYMKKKTANGKTFAAGYYYFDSNGRLNTTKAFRTVKGTINGVKFNGTYYFGDTDAKILLKAGWITFNSQKYYISKTGKRAENCWKSGYYLLSDGTIAKSMQVPDGSYVDWRGKKCEADEVGLSKLKSNIETIVGKYSGTWSVYVKNLETGDIINLNNKAMYPASTIKAFVMASTFDQINKGNITYSSTIKSYLKSMITVSDNEAYNQLIKRQTTSLNFNKGFAVVNQYLQDNGYTNTACHTTLSPSYTGLRRDGLGSNKASAKDCGVLLERIYNGTCVSKAYSKQMLNLLLAQQRTWKIPAVIPSSVKVANKTGETSTVQHDIAIVYGPDTDYVICVFASGVSEYYGIKGIKEVSKAVYNYLN